MSTVLDIGHITGGFVEETAWGDSAPVVRKAFEDTQKALNRLEDLMANITDQAPGNDGPVTINRTVINVTNLNEDLDHGMMDAASLLDDDHPQYLRSDASDFYSTGTLTFGAGTVIDVDGTLDLAGATITGGKVLLSSGAVTGALAARQAFIPNGIDVGTGLAGGIYFGGVDPSIAEMSGSLYMVFTSGQIQFDDSTVTLPSGGAFRVAGFMALSQSALDWSTSSSIQNTITPKEGLLVTNNVISSVHPILNVVASNAIATRVIFNVTHTGGITPLTITQNGVTTFRPAATHTLQTVGASPWVLNTGAAIVGTSYRFQNNAIDVLTLNNNTGSILASNLQINGTGTNDLRLGIASPEITYGVDSATPNDILIRDLNAHATGKLTQQVFFQRGDGKLFRLTQVGDGAGHTNVAIDWGQGDTGTGGNVDFIVTNTSGGTVGNVRYRFAKAGAEYLEFLLQTNLVSFFSDSGSTLSFTTDAAGINFTSTGFTQTFACATIDMNPTSGASLSHALTLDSPTATNRRIQPSPSTGIYFGNAGTMFQEVHHFSTDATGVDIALTVPGSILKAAVATSLVVSNATHVDGFVIQTTTGPLTLTPASTLNITDGKNIALGTGTGTQLGTATTQKLGLWGKTPVVRPAAYTPSNVSTVRSYDANATSIDELADVLGTLIADLQSFGALG